MKQYLCRVKILMVLVAFLFSTFSYAQRPSSLTPLDQELEVLNDMRKGHETDFNAVDRMAAELLKRYDAPEDQAKIYNQLIIIDGNTGMQRPEKLFEYAQKALSLPLRTEDRQRVHMYWGNAIEIKNRGATGQELAVVRKEAVGHYMTAIKENLLAQTELSEEMKKPAEIFTPDPRNPGPNNRQLGAENLRQANLKHDLENVSLWQKHHEDQIVYLHSKFPFETAELEEMASEIIGDFEVVNRLLERVNKKIDQRVIKNDFADYDGRKYQGLTVE